MTVGIRKRIGVMLAGAAMVATGVTVGMPAQAAFPGINGVLACASNRSGNFDIWTFNPNGTELGATNLTNHPASEGRPRYSPDGRQIVFESNRAGGTDLYIMNADGTNVQRLTFTGDATGGAWSPDGSQIAYQRNLPGLFFEVYKVNVDGTGVTPVVSSPAEDSLPAWSPDGTKLAVSSRQVDPAADVHIVSPLGTEPVSPANNLTNNIGVEDSWPTWSPDGTQIGFHSRRDDPSGEEIYRMPSTGGAATRLTFNAVAPTNFDIFPAWSPDGTRIVWNSGRNAANFGEVYQMNAVTGDVDIVRVTNNPATDQRCDWQPLCTIYGSGDILGTEGNDIICGSSGNDRIAGLGGNDRILGLGGDDQISGGAGDDQMFGGVGNDSITGGLGVDFTAGGPGGERIIADIGERIDVGGGTNFCVIGGAAAACPAPLS